MEFYLVFVFFAYSLQVLNAAPPVEVTPERIILLENRPLEVKCRVGVPITYCRFAVPGVANALSLRPGIPPHQGIQYIGAGLDKGECGMLIQSVSSKHSGTIQCSMAFLNEPTESTGNSTLIVAKPPDPPLLRVFPGNTYTDSFREGEIIQANCRISNARPIANISWYLGSEPIYDRLGPVVPEEENGLWTISQNLTRRVTYVDHGKDLKCVAGHIALGQGNINHSIYKLNVRFPPKPKSQELEKFGFTIGQPGKIVVTFQANPIPDIVWKVDQDNLQQGARDRNGRYEAGVLQHKGAGMWDAVLNINIVRAEEVEKRYTLVAQNELGHASYKVAISTSPEPPGGGVSADITAGAIVGIVIAVLIILLLVFLLIFARATGRWCFAGGVPRPPGESLLPYRRSYLDNRNPAKVNSLIYKDYTLVECEDGSKLYVSPEEKARLVVEGQIKPTKVSLENEKQQKRFQDPESGSETEYETPITPGSKVSTRESVEDPDKILVVKSNVKRNSSFPFSDLEASPGDNGRINLPPYIVPVETSLTLPMTKRKKDKKKKKKKGGSGGEEDKETDSDELFNPLTNSQENGLSSTKDKDDGEGKWRLGLKRSKPFWLSRDRRNEEMDDSESPESPTETERTPTPKEESKTLKKRFSFPWVKDKTVDNEEDKQQDNSPTDELKAEEPENGRSSKRFSLKLPRLSWKKGKKAGKDKEPEEGDDEDKTEEPPKEDDDEKYTYENDLSRDESKEDLKPEPETGKEPEKQPNLFSLIHNRRELVGDLEEPEEVFPEPTRTPKKNYSIRFPKVFPVKLDKEEEQSPREDDLESPKLVADVERNSQGFAFPQYQPKEVVSYRRDRNKGKVDANPLKGMFKVKRHERKPEGDAGSSRETLDQSHESEVGGSEVEETKSSRDTLNSVDDRPSILPDVTWYRGREPEETEKYFSLDRGSWYHGGGGGDDDEPEVSPQTHKLFQKLTDSGFLVEAPPKDADQPDYETASSGSDTESADHGSTDKSSVSKLTSEKQSKKLMSGLFGSLKMGKNKDKVSDNDATRNLSSFEVTVKEQPEEVVQVDGTRTDGIVYAELDMARSPNSVMRRDDDKTEYAEIIYPGSKIPAVERTIDELRKSRENLASSRENLTEAEEAFTTTMTPDGKKEAAV